MNANSRANTTRNLFCLALLICALACRTAAADIVHTVGDDPRGWIALGTYDPVGQSFVAQDEQIGAIGFYFTNANPSNPNVPITLTLYEGEGLAGAALASTTQLLPDSLPTVDIAPYPHKDYSFYYFSLAQVPVTIGGSYTAVLTQDDDTSNRVGVLFSIPWNDNGYAGGQMFVGRGPTIGSCAEGCDLAFHVAPTTPVPLPAAGWLLAAALAALRCARHPNAKARASLSAVE